MQELRKDAKEEIREVKNKRMETVKMIKKETKERGITLVALVVTIIIMLILAGVTLSIALGENGLFKMTRSAVDKYKEESAKEENALKQGSEEIANVIESLKPPLVIDGGEVGNNLKEYQGKYVDIGLDTNGNGNVDDWELFYAGNDRIFLIAADYVPTDTLEKEWGVIGDKGKLTSAGFKRASSSYTYNVNWSSSLTFLTLPTDPENYLDLVMHKGYDLNAHNSNNNSKAVSQLLNKDGWSGIKDAVSADKQDCIDFVIGGPTLEMWCAAWKEAIKGDTNGFVEIKPEDTNANGYYVSSDKPDMQNQYLLYMNGTASSLTDAQRTELENTYKTFFPHTGTSAWNNCDGYWLASPSAYNSNYLMHVYFGGYVYVSYCYSFAAGNYGVRPVVCLASGVQLAETFEGSNIYNISK